MNKNRKIYLIMLIIFLIIVVSAATYAFLQPGWRRYSEFNLGVTTGGTGTFTAYSEGIIAIDIKDETMALSQTSNRPIVEDNATIFVQLEGNNTNEITTCTYDLIWVWDGEDQYKESDVQLPYNHTDGSIFPYEFSVKVDNQNEKDLSSFSWNGNKTVISTRTISVSSNEIKKETIPIDVKIYNIPVVQNTLSEKNYRGHIEVGEAICNINIPIMASVKSGDLLADVIKTLYTDDGENDLYYHDGIGDYVNANLEAGDNSYRYAGANPNNYLCFGSDAEVCPNDNLYRIIGVFDDSIKVVKADFPTKEQLGANGDYNSSKVFLTNSYSGYSNNSRRELIDTYYWNKEKKDATYSATSKNNVWTYSSLNNINLNTNFLSTFSEKWKTMINKKSWIISGMPGYTVQPLNAKQLYNYELNETCSDCSGKASFKGSDPVYIGLVYASDLSYAANPIYWSYKSYDYQDKSNDYSAAFNENWLPIGMPEWTISTRSDDIKNAFHINSDGTVETANYAYEVYEYSAAIRPSFYLKPTVTYTSGVGTKHNPIRISDDSFAGYIMSLYTNDGVGDLYYHDGVGTYVNASLEANDNSLRYAGANPNNYVCFYGDACNDDNKYRIIGVFGGLVKLFKYKNIGSKVWNNTTSYNWEGSSLERYLNQEWITTLNGKLDLIADYTWSVGGFEGIGDISSNAKKMFDQENDGSIVYNAKIGLIYSHDHKYAGRPQFWNGIDSNATTNNWLALYQWTISKRRDSQSSWPISGTGEIGGSYGVTSSVPVYPCFYILPSVKIKSGLGTYSNPYIIGK